MTPEDKTRVSSGWNAHTNKWYILTLKIRDQLEKEFCDMAPYNTDQIAGHLASMIMEDSESDTELIISLQKQVADLWENAREIAMRDLTAEIRGGLPKLEDHICRRSGGECPCYCHENLLRDINALLDKYTNPKS